MTTSWRDIARRHLAIVSENAIAAYGNPGDWDAVTKLMVKRTIDAAYPFGTRENHPYKVWLEERKETLIELGIEQRKPGTKPKGRHNPKPKQDEVVPGQLSLW